MLLPLDRDALVAAVRRGDRFDYLHFWGHRAEADGSLGDGAFSQWFPSPFDVDGVTYATAEHWMMASKARLFGDAEVLAEILEAPSPAAAKKLGRRVRGFDESAWRRHRFDLVTRGNVAKFTAREAMRAHLLGTGSLVLVEASPTDTIWGIGLRAADAGAHDPARWRGANLLGFALVRARHILRGELPAP